MKRSLVCAAMVGTLLLSTGCTKKYERNDISDYVKEQCGIRDFKVRKDRQEIHEDEDGYTDYLWTVEEGDGTVFHVLDNYHWGMEALVNSLSTDYYDVHLVKAFPELPHHYFQIESETLNGLVCASLTSSFSTRNELHEQVNELEDIRRSPVCPKSVPYNMEFDFPYRTIDEYTASEGDTHGNLADEINAEAAEKKMLLVCVDHRLPGLSEFSEEEIKNAVSGNDHQIGVTNEDGKTVWYDDLCASQYSYGISFASVYEILVRNGYEVSGSPDHYSFSAPDGTSYEFSYSFTHPFPDGRTGYYYLMNGEETDMSYYFYNHFNAGMLKEKFGIDAQEYWYLHH